MIGMSSSIFLLLLFLFLFFSFVFLFLFLLLFCFVDIKEDDLETFVTFEEEVEDFVFPVPEESLLGGRPSDFFFIFLVVVVPSSFFTFVFFVGSGPELDDENSNGLFQTVFTFRVRLLSAEKNWSCDSIGITPFFCLDVAMIDCLIFLLFCSIFFLSDPLLEYSFIDCRFLLLTVYPILYCIMK
jgi:phosphoglycerol transferase MdoB-like AlkP superfamily enzyme